MWQIFINIINMINMISEMAKDVLIRGVDEQLYRRAKARAALRGLSLGKAVSDALKIWTEEEAGDESEEELLRNIEFAKSEWTKLKRHSGKAVVISAGKLQGVFKSYQEACAFSTRFKVALTFLVTEPPTEREIELGPELEV